MVKIVRISSVRAELFLSEDRTGEVTEVAGCNLGPSENDKMSGR